MEFSYVAGKIIEKIGLILAINNKEFTGQHVAEKLIENIPKDKKNIIISGLSTNSKEVKKNYIFFAIKGNKDKCEDFIDDAIDRGASVIVCSKVVIESKDIFVIKQKDKKLFEQNNFKVLQNKPNNIIAVTGTNGKTSVADFFQLFRLNNISAASIGTLGIKYNNKVIKTNLTSPDTLTTNN